ncbi:MAG: hypothetical protein ACOCRX_00205 [Candidatus Woesearchaeota archaeon]
MFNELFQELARQGVIDTGIPALLIFALFYAVLNETKIVSKKKGINTVLSLSFGLLFAYFGNQIYVQSGVSLVQLINQSILDVTVIILAVIMLFILIGSLGYNKIDFSKSNFTKYGFILFSMFIIVFIFLHSAGYLPQNISRAISEHVESLSVLIPVVVFGLVVYYVTKDDTKKPKKNSKRDKFVKELKNIGDVLEHKNNKKKNS